ncbi:MAG: MATE family efflux transporter [Clostridia bacterium]|nr:MATE family efflux transporter [Clostridia bacterium]
MQLEGKSLRSDFIRFVTASAASLMVFSLYSMVDGLLVSLGVNEYAMSAVNLAIPFTNALFSLAVMFAVGSSTIIAIHLAQGRKEEADGLFSQNFFLLLGVGLLISVAVFAFRDPFAKLLGADEVTLDYVKQYLLGLAPFSACFIISYNLEVLVKTDGYPKLAVISVTTGAVANCILDYIAIFWLDMGVFGAAVATGTSQLITCIIYLAHFFGPKCTFRLRKFRFDPRIYRRLIPIGLSDGVTELCNGLMILIFNRTVQKYLGADGLVTYTVIAYMNTIVINLMMGISQGSQPLVSYRYGKNDSASCKKLLGLGLKTALLFGAVCLVGLYLFAPQVVGAYLSEASPTLVADSVVAFRQYSFSWLLVGFNVVIGGFLTALERPLPAIGISTGRGLIVQATVLVALAAVTKGAGLWFTPIFSEIAVLAMAVFFLKRNLKQMKML